MAVDSQSDPIGQMLRHVAVDLGDWISALEAWPSDLAPAGRVDPHQQFRVLLDGWHRTFRDHLTQADKTYVFELRDVRNRWAHHDAFSADDVWRALDTGERLMRAIGANETAERLGRAKRSDATKGAEGELPRANPVPAPSRPAVRKGSASGNWYGSLPSADQAKLDRFQSWLEQVEHKSPGTASDYKSYVALVIAGGDQALNAQSPKRRSSIQSGVRAHERYTQAHPADRLG